PIRLRRLDHGEGHPVLHAARGVLGLQLQQDARTARRPDLAQGQERGIADPMKDVGVQFVANGGHCAHVSVSMHLQTMYIHRSMSNPNQPRKTLQDDARALIEACAGWNSRLAARRITQFLDRELAGCGLSAAQLGLMAQIAAASDDTLGALARRSGLDQSTLSRNLRTLEGAGLIEIAFVESDLRRRAVWLTETGARRL